MQQIPETISELIHLPLIPHVLLRLLNLVEDDNAPLTELAMLVGQDPALSARFLTIANSPALRQSTKIKDLHQCLVVLGIPLARAIVSCLAIQSTFSRDNCESRCDFTGFWVHSLRVAEMARALAIKINYSEVEEAYLAGLLHDIGQLLLLGGEEERYRDMLRCSIDESVLLEIEETTLGLDHAKVGACLVDQWQLSSFMSDAILFHHKPSEEITDADQLSKIVWSAHIISNYNDKIDLTQKQSWPDLAAVSSMMGLDLSDVAALRNQSFERVAVLAAELYITENTDVRSLPVPVIPFENHSLRQNDKDPAHSQLESTVRDLAIMRALHRYLAALDDEKEILLAVREFARVLFGLGRIVFLFVKPDRLFLSGPEIDGQPALLQELEIGLEPARSLVATVALGERVCSTLDNDLPVAVSLIDIQIARAIKSQGLIYVPMAVCEKLVGIMAYGVSASQHAEIQRHLPLMSNLAQLAAVSIEACRKLQERDQKLEMALSYRFKQHARKVVHEAGNPLSIIKNYLKIVSQKLPDENSVHQDLDILKEEIDRVAQILRQLGDMTETSPAIDSVDINVVIQGMLALYGDSLFLMHGISVEKQLSPSLSMIRGDRDSVKQILLNIWKNAAEAMPNGGCFVISTRFNVIRDRRLYGEICLTDSGPGLPQDVMQQPFQPLNPNRRPGHSGIGLSIVASLVDRLGGFITFQSSEKQGTSFFILLPQSEVNKNE